MKRERTKDFDVLRQGSTISIVERRSGVASSFVVPSEEAREALVRVLSDSLEVEKKVETVPSEEAPTERVETEVEATTAEPEKATTTKKRTTKKTNAK